MTANSSWHSLKWKKSALADCSSILPRQYILVELTYLGSFSSKLEVIRHSKIQWTIRAYSFAMQCWYSQIFLRTGLLDAVNKLLVIPATPFPGWVREAEKRNCNFIFWSANQWVMSLLWVLFKYVVNSAPFELLLDSRTKAKKFPFPGQENEMMTSWLHLADFLVGERSAYGSYHIFIIVKDTLTRPFEMITIKSFKVKLSHKGNRKQILYYFL